MKYLKWCVLIGLCLLGLPGMAQDETDCPVLVQAVVENVAEACLETSRNQVCYGNVLLEAEPYPDLTEFALDQPGDIEAVTAMKTLLLSPLDAITGEWGVALMKLQANLPDTLPGQNVTLLAFGDVELESDSEMMTAFYFRSGIGDAACAEAPNSGILVQTPEGAKQIEFVVNGVQIGLASTIYLTAAPEADMVVALLEGSAEVTVDDVTQTLIPGTQVSIPLDADLQPTAPPTEPAAYAAELVTALPLGLLEREIEMVMPADAGSDDTRVTMDVLPLSGQWQLDMTFQDMPECGFNAGYHMEAPFTFSHKWDGENIISQIPDQEPIIWTPTAPGVYEIIAPEADTTLWVYSEEHYEFEVVHKLTGLTGCIYTANATYIGPSA